MMNKEALPKIVNFMTHGAEVLMLGRGHISHYSEYAYLLYQYTANCLYTCSCV